MLASCSGGDHVTMSGDHNHSGSVQWIHCCQAQEGRICCRRAREGRICCWQTREGRIRCLARERLIRPRVWRKGGRRTACDHGTRSSDHDHDGCACGLGSDRSIAGRLRKGGSAAAWLENGGSTLACSRDKGGVVTVEAEKPWQQWPHCDLARALVFFFNRTSNLATCKNRIFASGLLRMAICEDGIACGFGSAHARENTDFRRLLAPNKWSTQL